MALLPNILDKVGTALRLPERGWSESLNNNQRTANTGLTPQSQAAGFRYNAANPVSINGLAYTNPAKSSSNVLGSQTSNFSPTGGTVNSPLNSNNSFNPTITSPNQPFSGGGGSEIDAINAEFNNFNSYLDQQAGTAQTNFNDTKALYDTSKANAETQYNTERTSQTEQAKKTEGLNLAKVRQLLSDLTQSNAARTAVTGGGSVSEAMGERFGRQAQSSLGNVMESTKNTIQRVNDFYNNSITKLNETYNSNILQAKQTLDENLGQIGLARTQSASAKQAATVDAWKNYYNQVNQAKLQAAQFKAQYDMWNQQQQSALGATAGWNEANNNQYVQDLSQSYNFQNTPGVNNTQASVVNPYYQVKKGSTQDPNDPYATA